MCKSILLLLLAALSGLAQTREERLEIFLKQFRPAVASLQQRAAAVPPTPTTRDLNNAALAILVLGGDPKQSEALARLAWQSQDMNPESPDFGNIPWQLGHPEIKDANAIEFGTQPLGPMLLRYGNKLSPEFKSELTPHIRAAIAAVRRHKVGVFYTNIFLMKTVNLILLNEALGNKQGADDGYAQLDQWIAYTHQNGVREFQSPTYYSVDLNSLAMGYMFAERSEARDKFRLALDYFWADIASNYFVPRGSLSGPHSRDYDFLTGHGGLEFQLFQEGLRKRPAPQSMDLEKVYFVLNEMAMGYRPPEAILKLASLPERIVRSRWEAGPDRDRYNYITPDFAIGSSSANYGPQDKPVSVELATEEEWPVITIVPDLTDQPYGKLKRADRSGHNKPVHLPLYPLSVQEKGAVLTLIDLNLTREEGVTNLATNIVVPARAQLSIDGAEVDAAKPFERALADGNVIGVRHGNAAVVMRLLRADGAGGQKSKLFLKADEPGLRYSAARIAAYHYRGDATKLTEGHIRVGVLMLAAACKTDAEFQSLVKKLANADVQDKLTAVDWRVSAKLDGVLLEAARDAKTRALLSRKVNGKDVETPVLNLNGDDLTRLLPTAK